MVKASEKLDMTSGPLFKKIVVFAIPLMFTSILQLLYNAADMIVVGKFAGPQSFAAVGSTTSLINLIVNLFMGLSMGTGVIAAQAIGAKNKQKLFKTVHTSILLSVIVGFLVGAFGFIVCRYLLALMSCPLDVIDKATLYMRVYFCGMPGFMVYNFGAAILRSAGDTKRPLIILSVSGIANVLLNVVFVLFFHLDVAGVALATIISQYISAVWVITILVKDNADYRLFINKLHIYKEQLILIFKYGAPMGIQSSMFSISNVVIQSAVNSFGTIIMAGNTAANNIEGFVYASANAVSQSAMTFAGQNTGANRYDRVKKVLLICMGLTLFISVFLSGLVLLFKESLLTIYTSEANIIAAGVVRLNIICLFYGLCGVMDTVANTVRGMGKSLIPMIITLVTVCFMRVLCVYTVFEKFKTIEVVYWSYPVTWGLAFIAQLIYFTVVYKSKKSKNKG